jgi:hypothetical protein
MNFVKEQVLYLFPNSSSKVLVQNFTPEVHKVRQIVLQMFKWLSCISQRHMVLRGTRTTLCLIHVVLFLAIDWWNDMHFLATIGGRR